jgi:hypothetical protein
VECLETPECRVGSQRVLCAFGLLLGHVAAAGEERALDAKSESFVPNVSHALRALFAYLRKESGERGLRDVATLLGQAGMCRTVLRMFGTVPSLVPRIEGERAAGGAVSGAAGAVGRASGVMERGKHMRVVRVATWNVAGGHRSAQAPEAFNAEDQRAAVMAEILRWGRAFGCDVIALQECEGIAGYQELLETHELVGAVEAVATRGYVHLYARRGMKYERVAVEGAEPCVVMRLDLAEGEAPAQSLVIAAAHLPIGDCAGASPSAKSRRITTHGSAPSTATRSYFIPRRAYRCT